MNFIDVEIVERPKTLLGQKICQWLDLKMARVGETGRWFEKGFYLLPKENEEKFMMYKTWQYGNPLVYCVSDIKFFCVHGYSEEELFYDVFLTKTSHLCFQTDANLRIDTTTFTKIRNPLFKMTVEEAIIWIDLNQRKA